MPICGMKEETEPNNKRQNLKDNKGATTLEIVWQILSRSLVELHHKPVISILGRTQEKRKHMSTHKRLVNERP